MSFQFVKSKNLFILGISLLIGSFTSLSPAYSNQTPKIWNVPNENPYFTGRIAQLNSLDRLIKTGNEPIVTIVGLSGIGKSQIAKAFAYKEQDNYDIVWWFDGSNEMSQQFINFAHEWNKTHQEQPELLISSSAFSPNAIFDAVRQVLTSSSERWLLVFDNINDPQSIEPYTPNLSLKNRNQHHIIVTSKLTKNWRNKVSIKPFQREESIVLIQKILPDATREESEQLAKNLGDYPLALMQAASYIKQIPSMNIASYIKLIQEKSDLFKKLDGAILVSDDNYHQSLEASLSLSLNELKNNSLVAYELLKSLAFLKHNGITVSFIISWLKENDYSTETLHEITFFLTSFGLLEEAHGEQKANGKDTPLEYEIHEQIQHVIRNSLSAEETKKILLSTSDLLSGFLSRPAHVLPKELHKNPKLYYNCKVLFEHLRNFNISNSHILEFKIDLAHAAMFVGIPNEYSYAIDLISEIDKSLEAGEKISAFSRARHLNTAGHPILPTDIDRAIKLTQEAVSILETLHDDKSKAELLFTLVNNLTDYYLFQGNIEEALKVCKQAEPLIKELNEQAYHVLFHSFLAIGYMYKGDLSLADQHIKLAADHIPQKEAVWQDHIFVDINLLEVMARERKYEEALILSKRLEQRLHQMFKNRVTFKLLRIQYIQAYILLAQGHIKEAKAIIEPVIKNLDQRLGKQNSFFGQAFCHKVLGAICEQEGNLKKAFDEYKMAESVFCKNSIVRKSDDLSSIYGALALLGIKMKREEVTHEYLIKHITHFGISHHRTVEIIKYLDENGLPLPI